MGLGYLRGDDVRQVVVAHCRSRWTAVMTSCMSVSNLKTKYSCEESYVDIWHSQITVIMSVPSVSSALGHTWAPSDILSMHRIQLRSPRCFRWPSETDRALPVVWLRSTPGLHEVLITSTWNRHRSWKYCDRPRRMKGWVGPVSWPTANGLLISCRCRPGKVRLSETDLLPLSYTATRQNADAEIFRLANHISCIIVNVMLSFDKTMHTLHISL